MTIQKRTYSLQRMSKEMTKQNTSNHSYTRPDSQGTLYVLRLSGFWGTLTAIAALLLLLPLVMAFFLLFVAGLVAVAVMGTAYAWWRVKKLRRVHASEEEDAIELAASEYHALEEPGGKARRRGSGRRLDLN
jgi:hypothetical protein